MYKKLVLLVLFFVFTNVLKSQEIDIQTFKLDNGLTVILNEDHSQNKVFGLIACKAGGKNDPLDATGMAHYQEHMLFKGTEDIGTTDWEKEKVHIDKIFSLYDELAKTEDVAKRGEIQQLINEESLDANKYAIQNEFSNLIKSNGGTDLNAGTGWDMTVYYNAFPPNQLESWLELNSNRFEKPVFRGFQQELEVVYEEKNLYSDIFIFPLLEQFNKSFFKNHPYGQRTLIGSSDDLKNPSLTKMFEFFKTYYVPNNMALVLSGDFDSDVAMEIIKEKFGDWTYKEIPETIKYEEAQFSGRELVEVNLSPIKLAFLGFRTVPQGDADENTLKIVNSLLSNSNSTGVLDKLVIDNKIMAAQVLEMPYFDHGASIILVIPKIIGQTLEEAEQLVIDEITKIKTGDFSDEQIEAIKNQLYIEQQLSLENLENRTNIIAIAFALNKDVDDYISDFEKIKTITKEDVIYIAKKYYGENYLAFYSKMGKAEKDKIEKPDYKPIIANTDVKSEYAKKLEEINTEAYICDFVDFEKDIKTFEIKENCKLFYTENNSNNIFSLKIKYGVGNKNIPLLKYSTTLMNVAGCEGYNVNDLKLELSKLGSNYSFSSDDDYLYVEMQGLEENLSKSLKLLNLLIYNPIIEENKIDVIIESEKTTRKMETSEPDNVADALLQNVLYGENSEFINRLTMKEIEALTVTELLEEYKKALNYEIEILYVGNNSILPTEKAVTTFKDIFTVNEKLTLSASPEFKDINDYTENTVYFVNKKDAAQSKIFVLINGKDYDITQQYKIDAFNLYFGGDFSGLVLQEIREYRSLAYSAGAYYKTPILNGKESMFIGFVGTQADKTIDALNVFNDLLLNMPEKTERIDLIKKYLELSAATSKPDFRNIADYIIKAENKGFTIDPAKYNTEYYKNLKFDEIVDFYKQNICKKPIVYVIVGNKKNIDMKELEKFGNVITIKESDLFTE